MHPEDSSPVLWSPFHALHGGVDPRRSAGRDPLVALMLRYLEGDRTVFDALYRTLGPPVRRQIRAILGGDPTVDDLVQDTFLRAHAARSSFDPARLRGPEGVVSWFCAIARNASISELRRRYSGVGGATGPVPEELPCQQLAAEHRALATERRRRVHDAVHGSLAQLPEPQRRVVELHKLRGLPMREVAAQLGIRPGAARVRAHRAYRTMADRLSRRDE
ncbi:MAG: sigma-70 family RNA polymerase sigma factor [Myxococcales bacterium]|nr:sigma-70 family RNA polymerase sigma factor [Myxococcales bacterium]